MVEPRGRPSGREDRRFSPSRESAVSHLASLSPVSTVLRLVSCHSYDVPIPGHNTRNTSNIRFWVGLSRSMERRRPSRRVELTYLPPLDSYPPNLLNPSNFLRLLPERQTHLGIRPSIVRCWRLPGFRRGFPVGRDHHSSAIPQRQVSPLLHPSASFNVTSTDSDVGFPFPPRSNDAGKELRLKQQYFWTSASLSDILRRFRKLDKVSREERGRGGMGRGVLDG